MRLLEIYSVESYALSCNNTNIFDVKSNKGKEFYVNKIKNSVNDWSWYNQDIEHHWSYEVVENSLFEVPNPNIVEVLHASIQFSK